MRLAKVTLGFGIVWSDSGEKPRRCFDLVELLWICYSLQGYRIASPGLQWKGIEVLGVEGQKQSRESSSQRSERADFLRDALEKISPSCFQ